MKKTMIPLLLLVAAVLVGCGKSASLQKTLTAGDGKWDISIVGSSTTYCYFYEDGSYTKTTLQGTTFEEGTFEVSEDEKTLRLVSPEEITVYRDIESLKEGEFKMRRGGTKVLMQRRDE